MTTAILEKPIIKNFDAADESNDFGKAQINVVRVEDKVFSRLTFQPGFSCTSMLKPEEKASGYCETAHLGFLASGQMRLKMKDGSEYSISAGSIVDIPPGHDGWVVGTEPAVVIDLTGKAPGS